MERTIGKGHDSYMMIYARDLIGCGILVRWMTRVKMYGVASLVDKAVRYFREPQAGDSMPANSSRVKLVKSLQQVEAKYKVVCS